MSKARELEVKLEECLHLAGGDLVEENKETFTFGRGMLSPELLALLHEAKDMRWPFVEEKWQYKRLVASEDKMNTTELISKDLPQLMIFLRAAILAGEPAWAMSVIFLLDRFFYWADGSHVLLKIAKSLHKRYPEIPVAPQIIIRQARVYLNTGKLQKAEYILGSLINNAGATGCWRYQRDSDRILVQAVSLQVRGQVLQKLGLWLEAAELIWASLVGFYMLPLPDKKGIGTSLGLLANILSSMNDEDFATFQKKPHINLEFLGNCHHRLLCAAQAARLAAVYSQFGSLYVLTHMVTQGTCLLSYSLSKACPAAEKYTYLTLATEAFENGLLTKTNGDVITSQQELHTLLRAAYCLAIANKWTHGPSDEIKAVVQSCQEAVALLYAYCFKNDCDKTRLSSEVMAKVQQVKSLLNVEPFANSDPRSFIPDSYRALEDRPIPFTVNDFTQIIEGFRRHHQTVCAAYSAQKCKASGRDDTYTDCITAFQTLTESLRTESSSITSNDHQLKVGSKDKTQKSSDPLLEVFQMENPDVPLDGGEQKSKQDEYIKNISHTTRNSSTSQRSSSLSSSWLNSSGHFGSSLFMVDPSCCTKEDEGETEAEVGRDCENRRYSEATEATDGSDSCKAIKDLSSQASSIHPDVPARSLVMAKRAETQSPQELGMTMGSECNRKNHQLNEDFSLLASADHRAVNKEQMQQQQQDLCSTIDSDVKLPVPNKMDAGTTRRQATRTSSGSLSSSLGSSWQSISFLKSSQNREQLVDESWEKAANEGSPDSPFEYVDLYPSAPPIQRGGSAQASDASKIKIGRGCVKNQSDIETEDPELLSFNHEVSELALVDANECTTKNLREASVHHSEPVEPSLKSSEIDSYEMVQVDNVNKENGIIQSNEKVLPHEEPEKQNDTPSPNSDKSASNSTTVNSCTSCFQGCKMGSADLKEQDYRSLLSGVCQSCLLKRLPTKGFHLSQYNRTYNAVVLKYSKVTDSWTGCESIVYVGGVLDVSFKGRQRQVFRVQYLHQELLLGSYIGKEYMEKKTMQAPLGDVERQMTAQFYVMEFNKRLYENNIPTQIFYLPSEILLLLENDSVIACVSVEPYMLGKFVKLTNNTTKVNKHLSITDYALAFGHFTYKFSNREEVVVDLQGWMTANGKGLMYLTDPQIHTLRKPRCPNNFHQSGISKFLRDQHGEDCNSICRAALHTLSTHTNSFQTEMKLIDGDSQSLQV